jgi:hypothetical protein
MPEKPLSIDLIVTDAGTQSRLAISESTVEDYAEIISASEGWPFPPLIVFHDGNRYLVADGFHRLHAASRAKRSSVPCIIHNGTAIDARIFGMTANDTHGLRMTPADKRECVKWLLSNEKKMTQAEIASKAGVSKRLVQFIVAESRPVQKPEKAQIAPSDDPFDVEEPSPGEEHAGGQDAPEDSSPRPPRSGKDKSGGSKQRTPAEEFALQRSKCCKTIEAAMREVDALNRLKRRPEWHDTAIAECKSVLIKAREW